MRQFIDLVEGPVEDREAHALATQLMHCVIKHFMGDSQGGWWRGSYMDIGHGRHIVRFEGKDLGWPTPYDTAVFGLEGTETIWDPSGFHTRFRSGKQLVCLKVNEDPVKEIAEAAKEIVHNQRVHNVLLHELIHMIDDVNHRREPDSKSSYPQNHDGPDYWNHALEFNAYFHNVSKRLNDFIARNRDSDSPTRTLRDAEVNKITPDFAETFKNAMGGLYAPQVKKFIASLRKHNYRRLMKRYYGLHQEAAAIIRRAQESQNNA